MKKFLPIVVVVVLLALGGGLFVAMNGGDDTDSAGSSQSSDASGTSGGARAATGEFDDACKVLARADIEAAFGTPFNDAKSEDSATAKTSCTFEQTNDGSPTGMSQAINLTITIENNSTQAAAKASLAATSNAAKVGDKVYFVRTDATGVGEEAFFFQGQAPAVLKTEEFLYARKGSQVFHFIAVRLDGIDHDSAKQKLNQLAAKALN